MNAQPINALVADYVAGVLAQPAKVLIDAHLEIVPESREWVQNLEAVAGHSLDNGPEEAITNSEAMIADILSAPEDLPEDLSVQDNSVLPNAVSARASTPKSDDWMPAALEQFVGLAGKDIPWRMKIPGVYVYKMDDVDGCEVMLLRIKPGSSVPTHTHEGRELALVLKGSFDDVTGHYARGDVSVADSNVDHKPVAGMSEECICFLINDAPVRFTGPVARIVRSFLPN